MKFIQYLLLLSLPLTSWSAATNKYEISALHLEECARSILFFNRINVATDFPKPTTLAEVEDPKWERAIPLIIAGLLLLPFPPTRKLGITLIIMGFEYLGWEYYNYVWDYLEEQGFSVDRTIIENRGADLK